MRLQTTSQTPQPLFEEIARQLFNNLINPQEVGEALREKISVEGESLQQVLREWVTVLIDMVRVQKMVFRSFRVTELQMPEKGPYSLRAEAVGELLDPQRHSLHADTPWLACREATLRKEGPLYLAEVVLDK